MSVEDLIAQLQNFSDEHGRQTEVLIDRGSFGSDYGPLVMAMIAGVEVRDFLQKRRSGNDIVEERYAKIVLRGTAGQRQN